MKRIEITLRLDCRDDVPVRVVEWMADNLAEHASNEFGDDYDPAFAGGYEGPPLEGDVAAMARVSHAEVPCLAGAVELVAAESGLPVREIELDREPDPYHADTLNESQVVAALAEVAEVRYVWSARLPHDNLRVGPKTLEYADAVTDRLLRRREELRRAAATATAAAVTRRLEEQQARLG